MTCLTDLLVINLIGLKGPALSFFLRLIDLSYQQS